MDPLQNEYFGFWYFKYILMLILFYFYLSNLLNAGLFLHYGTFTISEYFSHLCKLMSEKMQFLLQKGSQWFKFLSCIC